VEVGVGVDQVGLVNLHAAAGILERVVFVEELEGGDSGLDA